MRRSLAIIALSACTALPALAALPPQYQRQRELEAVLNAAVEALGFGNPVERIEMTAPDLWEVTGGTCHMSVTVVDAPTAQAPGPREFTVKPGQVICE